MTILRQVRDAQGRICHIETSVTGKALLHNPKLNKGNAFTHEERITFELTGNLPHQVETLEDQIRRLYAQYQTMTGDLRKNIYLTQLHDTNETLFFALVTRHFKEMLPIIYTPTVGNRRGTF